MWLQTTKAQTLSAATEAGKAAGIPVKLVVEPFTAVGIHPQDQLDRTILGDSYSQAEDLINGPEWVQTANERLTANGRLYDVIAENSPSLEGTWKLLAGLANSKGLAGTVVLTGTPVGYEQRSDWPEYEPPPLGAPLALGYTADLREKFLLANSVDPVDLLEVRNEFELQPLELSISSFGYLNTHKYGKVSDTPPSFRDKWDKVRSEVNEERLKQFESYLATLLLVEWRRLFHDTAINGDSVVSSLTGDVPAKTLDANDPFGGKIPSDAYYLQTVGYPLSDGATWHLRRHMATRINQQVTRFAIDLRAGPADQFVQAVKLLFTARTPTDVQSPGK